MSDYITSQLDITLNLYHLGLTHLSLFHTHTNVVYFDNQMDASQCCMPLAGLLSVYYFPLFSLLMEKDVIRRKKMLLTSEQFAKHLFAGGNIQHTLSLSLPLSLRSNTSFSLFLPPLPFSAKLMNPLLQTAYADISYFPLSLNISPL